MCPSQPANSRLTNSQCWLAGGRGRAGVLACWLLGSLALAPWLTGRLAGWLAGFVLASALESRVRAVANLRRQMFAMMFDLEEYATTNRVTRNAYLKATSEVNLAAGPNKAARDVYVAVAGHVPAQFYVHAYYPANSTP